jgi:hypothetical protein
MTGTPNAAAQRTALARLSLAIAGLLMGTLATCSAPIDVTKAPLTRDAGATVALDCVRCPPKPTAVVRTGNAFLREAWSPGSLAEGVQGTPTPLNIADPEKVSGSSAPTRVHAQGQQGSNGVDASLAPSGQDAGLPFCGDCAECPEPPTAYMFARNEAAYEALTSTLGQVGFRTEALPLDRSPKELVGLIFFGTDSSESAEYQPYMQDFGGDLFHFVDRANTLVQMSQSPRAEASPPFLPTTQATERSQWTGTSIDLLQPDSELLEGVSERVLEGAVLDSMRSVFTNHGGFSVLAAETGVRANAAILEGAYGQGRIVLSALPLDEEPAEGSWGSLRTIFFENLRRKATAVCERNTEPLVLEGDSVFGAFEAGSSSLVVLPDTQVYSLRYPGLFFLQTAWIAKQAGALDVRAVFHLGDIVNNNTEMEWERAAEAMSVLTGRVPVVLAAGNHDYGPSGDASTRDTLMNDYFDFDEAARDPTFESAFEAGKLDNTAHLISITGHDLVVLALEWGPRDAVVDWANDVMSRYPDREGVLVTHAYLNNNDRRYDHTDTDYPQDYNPHEYKTPDVNDGEELWQKLVKRHRFVMTLNGHVLGDGTGFLESKTDVGNTCHQVLANYQMRELGGEAYLRVLEFLANGTTVRVHSYSPLLGDFMEEEDQSFEFELD